MSDYPNDPALPGEPVPAPEARALPSDVVTLDGPVPGDPLELVPRLTAALSRPGPAVVVATSGVTPSAASAAWSVRDFSRPGETRPVTGMVVDPDPAQPGGRALWVCLGGAGPSPVWHLDTSVDDANPTTPATRWRARAPRRGRTTGSCRAGPRPSGRPAA